MTTNVISAPGTGSGDAGSAINSALSGGDSVLVLPNAGGAGYTVDPSITTVNIPQGVTLLGEGRSTTILHASVLMGNSGADYGVMKSLLLEAPQNANYDALIVADSVGHIVEDCIVFYGRYPLNIAATDCYFINDFIGFGYGHYNVYETGANWFVRCKFDSDDVGPGSGDYFGFFQDDAVHSTIVQEVHFDQCDFSGQHYTKSYVCADAYNKAIVFHDASVFSTTVDMDGHLMHGFTNCEFGGDVYNDSGHDVTITGCKGIGGSKTIHQPSGGVQTYGNTDIS